MAQFALEHISDLEILPGRKGSRPTTVDYATHLTLLTFVSFHSQIRGNYCWTKKLMFNTLASALWSFDLRKPKQLEKKILDVIKFIFFSSSFQCFPTPLLTKHCNTSHIKVIPWFCIAHLLVRITRWSP